MTNDVGRLAQGLTSTGFEPVRDALDAMLLSDATFSAQLAVYWRGNLVVDLAGGADLSRDNITGVFSASKGIAALTLGLLIDAGELDLDERVAHYWPEFATMGKQAITVRQLLSHQAGLPGVDGGFSQEEMLNPQAAAARLAAQLPMWQPGTGVGYHGITIGMLMEELTRRITGGSLPTLYEASVRAPRDIDFYFGPTAAQNARYRNVLPMVPTAAQAAEMAARPGGSDGLTALMFNTVNDSQDMFSNWLNPNTAAVRASGPIAMAGVGSARGLATAYAAALGFVGDPLLSERTVAAMSQQQSCGVDLVLGAPMSFGVVFMKPQPRMGFGSYRAFGHDGGGGALAFADPLHELSFGYIPCPMQYPGGADPKAVRLTQILRECTRRLVG